MLRTLALAALKFVPATDSCAASFFPGCSTIESTAIVLLGNQGVDLIDSSGGTYFLGAVASSDRHSAAPYFLDFARPDRTVTNTPLSALGNNTEATFDLTLDGSHAGRRDRHLRVA